MFLPFSGRKVRDQPLSVTGRVATSPGSSQDSWRQLEAMLAAERGGAPQEGWPHDLASCALTVFLIEELFHLLPEDHLLPQSVGVIFICRRKTRGSESGHSLATGPVPSPMWHLLLEGSFQALSTPPQPAAGLGHLSAYTCTHLVFSEQLPSTGPQAGSTREGGGEPLSPPPLISQPSGHGPQSQSSPRSVIRDTCKEMWGMSQGAYPHLPVQRPMGKRDT